MLHDWSPLGTCVCYNCSQSMDKAGDECHGGDAAEPEDAWAALKFFMHAIGPMKVEASDV